MSNKFHYFSYWIHVSFTANLTHKILHDRKSQPIQQSNSRRTSALHENMFMSMNSLIIDHLDFVEVNHGCMSICKQAIVGDCFKHECKFIIYVMNNVNSTFSYHNYNKKLMCATTNRSLKTITTNISRLYSSDTFSRVVASSSSSSLSSSDLFVCVFLQLNLLPTSTYKFIFCSSLTTYLYIHTLGLSLLHTYIHH
jgi:ADP-dependent phosphofructokinase/glucokinase